MIRKIKRIEKHLPAAAYLDRRMAAPTSTGTNSITIENKTTIKFWFATCKGLFKVTFAIELKLQIKKNCQCLSSK